MPEPGTTVVLAYSGSTPSFSKNARSSGFWKMTPSQDLRPERYMPLAMLKISLRLSPESSVKA